MSHPRVVELELGVRPEAAVSGALVIQSEYTTVLTFNAMREGDDGFFHDAGTAVVEVVRCLRTKFGLPNDEALEGHPLAASGLEAYACFEVIDSPWRAEAEAENRVAFPATDYSSVRHFIFTFYDSSFERLVEGLDVRVIESGRLRAEYEAITERIFSE